jgi:hypothetical protein
VNILIFIKGTVQVILFCPFKPLLILSLQHFFSIWYTKGEDRKVKILPSKICDLLTPRGLAYWLSGRRRTYGRRRTVIRFLF